MTAPKREQPGTVSLSTVAEKAGVSISTVSRIVNGETRRAGAATVERVRQAIEELGYRPNHIGRSLRRRETRWVAMLIANLDNPAMAAIAASTEAALRAAGYVMFLCDTHDRPELQDDYLYAMRSQGVRGYVLVTTVPSPGLAEFVRRGEPMVFVGRRNPCGEGAFVGIDNLKAGADAADFLWGQGVADFGVLYSSLGSQAVRDRVDGFSGRLCVLGADPARLRQSASPGLFHMDVGYQAARALVAEAPWPRGVFCVSDQIAYGAYRFACESGIKVPEDCILFSVDGTPLNTYLCPRLRSIRVPYRDFGGEIVDVLTDLWGGAEPSDRILPHDLV